MKLKLAVVVLIAILSSSHVFAQKKGGNPSGLWTTISEKTGKPRSVIRLSVRGNKIYGRLVKVFLKKGEKTICRKCPPPFKNKKLAGLQILWGVKATGPNNWDGGRILDPKTGKIYRCKMTLSPDGRTLKMRGYVGMSMFGRTQTWRRR